jgi:hypothetical protein
VNLRSGLIIRLPSSVFLAATGSGERGSETQKDGPAEPQSKPTRAAKRRHGRWRRAFRASRAGGPRMERKPFPENYGKGFLRTAMTCRRSPRRRREGPGWPAMTQPGPPRSCGATWDEAPSPQRGRGEQRTLFPGLEGVRTLKVKFHQIRSHCARVRGTRRQG